MKYSRIVLVESSLKNTLGHYYEYVLAVSAAAGRQGIPVSIAAHRDVDSSLGATLGVVPTFRMTVHDKALHIPFLSRLSNQLTGLVYAFRFFRDWDSSSVARELTPGTLVFVPSASEPALLGLALWLRIRRVPDNVKFCCLLRREPRRFLRSVIRLLRPFIDRGDIILTTDSDELSHEFTDRTGIQFTTLPIPHVHACGGSDTDRSAGAIRLLFPGGARDEKGIDVLAHALAALVNELAAGRLHVTIQCNTHHYEALTQSAIAQLDELHARYSASILLIKTPVSTQEYSAQLSAADVVLLPYRAADYISRTSGIFAEALAAGKPVIVTGGTWMASQLKSYGAGILIRDGVSDDLVAAIHRMMREYPSYAEKAGKGVRTWLDYHSGDNLLKIIDTLWDANSRIPEPLR
jgi:glycosyltransferase involved in cell wall biosynthesis